MSIVNLKTYIDKLDFVVGLLKAIGTAERTQNISGLIQFIESLNIRIEVELENSELELETIYIKHKPNSSVFYLNRNAKEIDLVEIQVPNYKNIKFKLDTKIIDLYLNKYYNEETKKCEPRYDFELIQMCLEAVKWEKDLATELLPKLESYSKYIESLNPEFTAIQLIDKFTQSSLNSLSSKNCAELAITTNTVPQPIIYRNKKGSNKEIYTEIYTLYDKSQIVNYDEMSNLVNLLHRVLNKLSSFEILYSNCIKGLLDNLSFALNKPEIAEYKEHLVDNDVVNTITDLIQKGLNQTIKFASKLDSELREKDNRINFDKIRSYVRIDQTLSDKLKELVNPIHEECLYEWRARNYWIHDPPNFRLCESNEEVLDQVYEQCRDIPGFEVTYLRKTHLTYFSDGRFEYTPDAINEKNKIFFSPSYCRYFFEARESEKDLIDVDSDVVYNSPCIYHGEAWIIKFVAFGIDVLDTCRVYFATPDQFHNAYIDCRPDLLEGFQPFSNLMVITSDWCSRNNPRLTYDRGIDLYTPWGQRQSLAAWIMGPCFSKNLYRIEKVAKKNIKVLNGYTSREVLAEWQVIQDKNQSRK